MIDYRKTLWWRLIEVRLSQSPGGRACLCVFFFCLVCLCCYVFPPGPIQCIFHTPMAWYSLYMLKVLLNTKQTNKLHHTAWLLLRILFKRQMDMSQLLYCATVSSSCSSVSWAISWEDKCCDLRVKWRQSSDFPTSFMTSCIFVHFWAERLGFAQVCCRTGWIIGSLFDWMPSLTPSLNDSFGSLQQSNPGLLCMRRCLDHQAIAAPWL